MFRMEEVRGNKLCSSLACIKVLRIAEYLVCFCKRRYHQSVPRGDDLIIEMRPWTLFTFSKQSFPGCFKNFHYCFRSLAEFARSLFNCMCHVEDIFSSKHIHRIIKSVACIVYPIIEIEYVGRVRAEDRTDFDGTPDIKSPFFFFFWPGRVECAFGILSRIKTSG